MALLAQFCKNAEQSTALPALQPMRLASPAHKQSGARSEGRSVVRGRREQGPPRHSPQHLRLLPSCTYSPQGTVWSLLEAWKLFDIRSHHVLRGEINSKEVTRAFYSFILLWRVLDLLTAWLNNITSRIVFMFQSTTKWNSACAKNTIHSIVSVIYSWTNFVLFYYLELT